MKNFNDMITALLQAVSKRQDIVLVTIVITAVFMMILPLPTLLVDALIAINITLSVLTLIFAIITVVQFIVITKGAERVAEVSARFSLDGMPGRQMSIDGDMRAGALTA